MASSRRSRVRRPSRRASIIQPKSSSGSLKNKNRSQPAMIAIGRMSRRLAKAVMPTMCEASVTTTPLKPSLPRSRSVVISLLSVAGVNSLESGAKCF